MAVAYDGYSTLLVFGRGGAIVPPGFPPAFRIKTVTPPELDGGGPLDTTDMNNVIMRTSAPKNLLTLGSLKMTVYYDSALVLAQLLVGMQFNCFMVIRFPDGSGWGFWGWMEKFTPHENREGENPLADVEIHPSNAGAPGYTNNIVPSRVSAGNPGAGSAAASETFPTQFAAGVIPVPVRFV